MARRYLGMSPEQWDDQPWWQRRAYLEGFEEEGLVNTNGENQPGGLPVQPENREVYQDLSEMGVGGFAAHGLREEII